MRKQILEIVAKFFPQIEIKLIFKNNFTVGSFFGYKDRVSPLLSSNVVYLYTCSHCGETYCGETSRHLQTRISEHGGISSRTGRPLANNNSRIFDHKLKTGHPITQSDFKIIQNCKNRLLKIQESIHILRLKPTLNSTESSTKLEIL